MKMFKIAAIHLILICFLATFAPSARSAEVGEPMPDFAVQTFDGKSISSATLAGKPAMLVFWNTWCDDCLRDLPIIDRLAREFVPRGLAVLAVNTGLNDSEGKARAYWQRYGYGFPTGYDHSFAIGTAFKVRGVPTVFLIDSKGIVRYNNSLPPKDMEERFRQLTGK
jgi:cytochrome c biogenesis protein CcmG/thiol:disulfide interchange protein DsbE